MAHCVFSTRAQHAIDLADARAAELGLEYIGTEHLLAGLLEERTGPAAQLLNHLGVTAESVRPCGSSRPGRRSEMCCPLPRWPNALCTPAAPFGRPCKQMVPYSEVMRDVEAFVAYNTPAGGARDVSENSGIANMGQRPITHGKRTWRSHDTDTAETPWLGPSAPPCPGTVR